MPRVYVSKAAKAEQEERLKKEAEEAASAAATPGAEAAEAEGGKKRKLEEVEETKTEEAQKEKKEKKEEKEQSGEIGILKAEVMTLQTSNTELKTSNAELKTLTTTMEEEIKKIEGEVKEVKECCQKNKEGLVKVNEDEKNEDKKIGGEIAKLEKKDWDTKVNRLAKAKLIINYKPDWTVYISSNYPMEKQNKALQCLENVDDDKSFVNETPYSQFVGGTADNRKRMFSIIDLGEKVQVSRLVYFSTWGASMLFLTKIAVHYYTPDNEFDVSKPNGADFTLLKEEMAKKCTYAAKGS